MSGFEDDFGDMVGGKNVDTIEDAPVDDHDPAAEFLAREQEQLGDLETEIGPLSGKFGTLLVGTEKKFCLLFYNILGRFLVIKEFYM